MMTAVKENACFRYELNRYRSKFYCYMALFWINSPINKMSVCQMQTIENAIDNFFEISFILSKSNSNQKEFF